MERLRISARAVVRVCDSTPLRPLGSGPMSRAIDRAGIAAELPILCARCCLREHYDCGGNQRYLNLHIYLSVN
jgi:hypothetical protein